jgi:hypothetical protein
LDVFFEKLRWELNPHSALDPATFCGGGKKPIEPQPALGLLSVVARKKRPSQTEKLPDYADGYNQSYISGIDQA